MRLTRHPASRLTASSLLAATVIMFPATSSAPAAAIESTVVTGVVTDDAGKPLAESRVSIAERRVIANTRTDGRYTMKVIRTGNREQVTLLVQRIGFTAHRMTVLLSGDTVRVPVIVLKHDTMALSEVVTTGTMTNAPASTGNASVPASTAPAPVRGALGAGAQISADAMSRRVGTPTYIAKGSVSSEMRRDRRPYPPGYRRADPDSSNTEAYDKIDENPFRSPKVAPLSTFSVDVDRASYSNVRRFLNQGQLPPKDAVRIEELVNYFPYGDEAPGDRGSPIRISTELTAAPWNPTHDLLRIALRARDVDMRRAPASNLVFLVDVSGSMAGPSRLPLVKQALALLVNELREEDRVAIVVYAGSAGLVLPSTAGSNKQRILGALDGLEAGGSTAGGAGIKLAYDIARQQYIAGGNNRVVLCTDGDFNVGQSSDGELVRLIEQRRTEGAYLTILGFGMGNYKDSKMEKLSGAGNGNYGYIDDLLEARKMLVKEMGGTLLTVAKDVKLQVEFNPSRVQAYRLLGYEDRLLRDEDFSNDAKDAGDVGAGHTVTALYEIVRTGEKLDVELPDASALRYQKVEGQGSSGDELLHVAMRYKSPDGDKSMLVTHPVGATRARPSEAMRFASSVAAFGMLLRESPNRGSLTWEQQLRLARGARGADEDGYRADFIRLSEAAAALANRRVGIRE